jgi:hypothetical protein
VNPFTWIKNQPLLADRRAVWLVVINLLFSLFSVLFMLGAIDRREFKVPIRYSGYNEGSLSDRGEWYSLYGFVLFALLSLGLSLILSFKVHRMRPELAQGLLGLQLLVTSLTLLVTRALTNLL